MANNSTAAVKIVLVDVTNGDKVALDEESVEFFLWGTLGCISLQEQAVLRRPETLCVTTTEKAQ